MKLFIFIVTAYLGLWLYLFIASIFKWIEPVWWGGKALFLPIVGTIYVPISSLLTYTVLKLIEMKYSIDKPLHWHFIIVGGVLGFIFFPCLQIINIEPYIPGWGKLNPYLAVNLGLAINSLFSTIIASFVFFIMCKGRSSDPKIDSERSI